MVDTSLTEHGIDFEQKHRLELLLEKTLLAYSENDKNAPLRIITHRTYKKISVMVFIKCACFDPKDIVESIPIEDLLIDMTDRPKWKYRHGENILIYTSKTLVPGLDALKQVVHYMDKEKKAFRTGVALRFVNMLLLVVEPLLAARIITAFNASELQKILLLAILMAILDAFARGLDRLADKIDGLSDS